MLNNLARALVLIRYSSCHKTKLELLKSQQFYRPTRWIQLTAQRLANSTIAKRVPVVTIMGHVDHGKTTLLDHLRNSQIVQQEFGGITQHIGAFVVPFKQRDKTDLVTFLDTPGHAAFASMRQRGANITDIVVLVVACEDGILDQTIESIKYAKNSQVPLIVAVNKIDKFSNPKEMERNIELIRRVLITHDVVCEDEGGDVQLIKISALKGIGIEDLKEAILALAETLDLKSELDCPVQGRVIESLVHPHRGKMCTILVQKGQLIKGSCLVAGAHNWARVRAMFDERNQLKQSCEPGLPIQVTGWREEDLPAAGDPVNEVENEQEAKSIISQFKQDRLLEKAAMDAEKASMKAEEFQKVYKEKLLEKRAGLAPRYRRILFSPRGTRLKESDDTSGGPKIDLILKCDVDGSLDAILDLLDTYDKNNEQPVKLDIMHYGVGPISQNDLLLATTFPNSVIYGFNVKLADKKIFTEAKNSGVNLKMFNVIYHLIDDLKERINEKMPETNRKEEVGQANVIQGFVVSEGKKRKSAVAGCRCSRGSLKKSCLYSLVRNKVVIADGLKVKSLKHFKDDVKVVEKDHECGISFLEENDAGEPIELEFLPGDLLVAYEMFKQKLKVRWNLKGFS